jgi:hypothetical protein
MTEGLFALGGVLLGGLITAGVSWWVQRQASAASSRTETLALVRWAADKTVGRSEAEALVGIATLDALVNGKLLQSEDLPMVESIYRTVLGVPTA